MERHKKMKKWTKKNPVLLIAILAIIGLVIAQGVTLYHFPSIIYVKSEPLPFEDPLEAWSEASYIVWEYNSSWYGCRNMSTDLVEYLGPSDDIAIQWGIDNQTAIGGTVYVKAPHSAGTYNAAVTLKDKVRLVLANGAAGITVTIDAGATASLEDFHNFDFKRWDSGVLVGFQEDRSSASEASYTIFREGSFYFARNGTTGSIDFTSTNFTVVWENARDEAPSTGAWLHFKEGNFTTGVMLYVNRGNLKVTGEGRATKIVPSATFFTDNLGDNDSNVLMRINGHNGTTPAGGSNVENVEISHLAFDGQYNTFDVLSLNANVSYSKLHDLWIYNGRVRGIYLTTSWDISIYNNYIFDSSSGMQINHGQNIKINDNYVIGGYYSDIQNKGNGIYWNAGFNYTITDNVIIGNKWDTATGVYPAQNATSNSLVNGISGFGGEGLTITNNKILEVYAVGIWVYLLPANYGVWYGRGSVPYPHGNTIISENMIVGYGYDANNGRGIHVGASGGPNDLDGINGTIVSNNLIVQGNTGTTGIGIVIQNSPYTIVDANHVSNTTSNTISILNSNYTIVSNNIVNNWDYDNTTVTSSGGIFLQNSSWCIINGNICSDYKSSPEGDYGIYLYLGVHYTIVSSNVANPYETAGIKEGTDITNAKYIGNWNGTAWLSGDG